MGAAITPSLAALGVTVPYAFLPSTRHDWDSKEQAEKRDRELREVVVLQTPSRVPTPPEHPGSSGAAPQRPQKRPDTSELLCHPSPSLRAAGAGRADTSVPTQP